MGLFDDPIKQIDDIVERSARIQKPTVYSAGDLTPWPEENSLVLEEDTAVELGNPKEGSAFFVYWTDSRPVVDGRITLIGPALSSLIGNTAPFALFLFVSGDIDDPYDCHRDLKDAVYDTRPSGFMVRALPSRQTLWCRVSKEAVKNGLTLGRIAATYIDNLHQVDFVRDVEALVVTLDKNTVKKLAQVARESGRVIGALVKITEQLEHDCESCEYWDVCASVEQLRKMRNKIVGQNGKQ